MKPWKIQKFFGDVIYDLRNRNLLSVAVMLIFAIIAVPVLIAKSGGSEPVAPASNLAAENASGTAPETQAAVLAYDPGVRNYKQRLDALAAKDPFKQQFTGPGAASASTLDQAVQSVTGSTSSGTSTGEIPSTTTPTGGSGGDSGGGSGGGGSKKTKVKTKTRYYSYDTDVLVGEVGLTPAPYNKIAQFTMLPSAQVPVLVFLGVTSGGTQAIFLVAKDVTSVGGDGVCYPSPDSCQLLGLNAGKGADLVYGIDQKTYHLQVTRIKRVVSSKPPAG